MKIIAFWFKISQKCVPRGLIDNKSELSQVMAWWLIDAKPLPEHAKAMMAISLT